jgi:hypothetical protein
MPLRRPEDFESEGSLRKAPVNKTSIDGWMAIAKGKVADAQREANSPTTRLGAAYDAMLNLSLALLCKHGWRSTSAEGHHIAALEVACGYAGIGQTLFDEVDAIRDLRNDQYKGMEPKQQDIEYALEVLEKVLPKLLEALASNPLQADTAKKAGSAPTANPHRKA